MRCTFYVVIRYAAHLLSSSIRLTLVCKRPAVSTITRSALRALAASIASYTTAAGSAPSLCLTIGAPTRSAHMDNWSAAAARNVSPAAMITFYLL